MLPNTLLSLAFAALACAQTKTYTPHPNPKLNPNPTNTSDPRLVGKAFPYSQIPYQADTSDGARGKQTGYNICNSTTQGQTSLCQTLIINDINDFCIWGPPNTGEGIGDTEEEEVAWCTLPTHGTRVIPPGTFTGLQFIRTNSYIEITGELDQTKLGIKKGDGGGELDSGGQDTRGNPMGGLVYSNNLPSSNGAIIQSRSWHMFIGGNQLCLKACDPNAPDAAGLCQHRYDTIGCAYNVPASYQNNVFLSCQGDDQDAVGIYTSNGLVYTLSPPAEDAIPTIPYTPRIPASSNCITYSSAQLFQVTSSTSASVTSTGSSTATGTPSPSGSGTAGASSGGAPGTGSCGSNGSSGSAGTPTPSGTAGSGNGAVRTGALSALVLVSALLLGAATLA